MLRVHRSCGMVGLWHAMVFNAFAHAQRRPTSATPTRPRARRPGHRRFLAVRATVAHSMPNAEPSDGAGPVSRYREHVPAGPVVSLGSTDSAAPQRGLRWWGTSARA
jgi:hypothetical protein